MRKQLICGGALCLMPFCCSYGSFVFQSGFKGPIICPQVTETNIGEDQQCGASASAPGPWNVEAYNEAGPFDGLTLTMQTTQANGTIPFMQRDPLIIGPGGQAPNQEIPFEVKWKPCFNDFGSGGSPPDFMEMPANQGVSVAYEYGGSLACSSASSGKVGQLEVTRKSLSELPEEGTYTSSITFVVSAE